MLADGILTYITISDTTRISNPLIDNLGLGIFAVVIANIIAFIAFAYLSYFLYVKYKTKYIKAESSLEYACGLFYDRTDKPIWLLYKTPKHLSPLIAVFAFMYIYSMLLSKLMLVVEECLLLLGADLSAYNSIFWGRADVAVCFVCAIILMFAWFKTEYKKSADSK